MESWFLWLNFLKNFENNNIATYTFDEVKIKPFGRYNKMSMMNKMPMTPAGLAKLEAELKDLKYNERPAIIQAISEARALGDLSENAEYHSAKDRQGFIEGRISYLEGVISSAEIIDPKKLVGDTTVKFSATVTIVDEETDEEKTYQIVGKEEADLEHGKISFDSPIARALIGKAQGDEVTVQSPKGPRDFEILSVEYV